MSLLIEYELDGLATTIHFSPVWYRLRGIRYVEGLFAPRAILLVVGVLRILRICNGIHSTNSLSVIVRISKED